MISIHGRDHFEGWMLGSFRLSVSGRGHGGKMGPALFGESFHLQKSESVWDLALITMWR